MQNEMERDCDMSMEILTIGQITHFVRCSYGESMRAGELRHLSSILYRETMVPNIE